MIESIEIENFQAHERLRIDLDPAAVVIVGPSDVGKSAVLRALRWLSLNRPAGDAFLRDGEDTVSVKVVVDGHEIVRSRGKSGNEYRLDGERFVSFGNDVPDAIANLLNLDDVNFQTQHESPFWLGLSPPELSRELNAVVDLSQMDRSLSWIANEIRTAKTEIAIREAELIEARNRRDSLAWVEEADATLLQLAEIDKILIAISTKSVHIASMLSQGEKLQRLWDRAAQAKCATANAIRIADSLIAIASKIDRLQELVNLAKPRKIGKFPKAIVEGAVRIYGDGLLGESKLLGLQGIVNKVTALEKALCRERKILGDARRELAKVKTCPLCNHPLGS